jgi:hypothetical protein
VNTTLSDQTVPLLAWKCAENSQGGHAVRCANINNFDCGFGIVENVTGSCECNDALIVSEATFTAKSTDARILICSDGTQEEEISVAPTVLYTPVLRYTMIHSDKETRNLRHVSIKWTTPDRTKKDMEYKLSIKDDSRTTNWTTEVPHINLNLTVGVLYTATVFSQRCNGGLRSNFSVPLDIFLEEIRVPESSKIPDSTSGNPSMFVLCNCTLHLCTDFVVLSSCVILTHECYQRMLVPALF